MYNINKRKEINSQRTNLYIDVHIRINLFILMLYVYPTNSNMIISYVFLKVKHYGLFSKVL